MARWSQGMIDRLFYRRMEAEVDLDRQWAYRMDRLVGLMMD